MSNNIETVKLASELSEVLAKYAPQFTVGRRYTNGIYYVTVRRTPIQPQPRNQLQMFERSGK